MSGIVDADLQNPQAQQALLALLGTTNAHLKEIDRNIVGSSSNIQSKLNVNQIIQDVKRRIQAPAPQPPPANTVNAGINVQHIPVPAPGPTNIIPHIGSEPVAEKLDKILEKLDTIINALKQSQFSL